MAKDNLIEVSGGWEGYALGTVERLKAGENNRSRDEVNIELVPIAGHPRRCSGCAMMVTSIHDIEERWVRELPLFDQLLAVGASRPRALPAVRAEVGRSAVGGLCPGHAAAGRLGGVALQGTVDQACGRGI